MATFTVTENFGTYQGNTSYIIDGNTSNCWRADNQQGSGKYVLVTASELIQVRTVVYSTTQTNEVFKSGASLRVSEDNSNWTTIGSFNGNASQTFTVNRKAKYIQIYCTSGSDYVSISELAINYDAISTKKYTVTVDAKNGATTDKDGENSVQDGDSFEVTINGTVNTITDNGLDVKGQLESHTPQSGGTVTKYPASYSTSGSNINGTRYRNCIGKGSSTTATGNDYASGNSSSTAVISYKFDFSDIPENATIDSVTVKVGGHAENTSWSTATLQLYSGSTAKGSQSKFSSTSKQVITMTPGTWTRAELQNATLRFTIGYYGGLVNGVDWTVAYSVPGDGKVYYTYVIPSVTADHLIAINSSGVVATRLRVKPIGSSVYKKALKIYVKENGTYVLTDESAFSPGDHIVWK